MIHVLDCGSQYTQNITRKLSELGVPSTTTRVQGAAPEALMQGLAQSECSGIIISGSPFGVADAEAPRIPDAVFECGKPVLGICYGMQVMAKYFGARVHATQAEYGACSIMMACALGPLQSKQSLRVWASHADSVATLPCDFELLCETLADASVRGMQHKRLPLMGLQFHPEVDDCQHGMVFLREFLKLCGIAEQIPLCVKLTELCAQVPRARILVACSGGVDSTALALLLKHAGADFRAVFVDNGLLRDGEALEVREALASLLGDALRVVDESEAFLSALQNITDPTQKRTLIGHLFARVLEREATEFSAEYLAQGTLASDVIESGGNGSALIKRHHNTALPEGFDLALFEPFRALYKDQVRLLARELGLAEHLTWRHPCPGPALAIRIDGAVTRERLALLRAADAIFTRELRARKLYACIAQAFAFLCAGSAVGVRGDAPFTGAVIGLRAVVTRDFMTASVYAFDMPVLEEISARIVREVEGVARVLYDISQKPPSTIEIQ